MKDQGPTSSFFYCETQRRLNDPNYNQQNCQLPYAEPLRESGPKGQSRKEDDRYKSKEFACAAMGINPDLLWYVSGPNHRGYCDEQYRDCGNHPSLDAGRSGSLNLGFHDGTCLSEAAKRVAIHTFGVNSGQRRGDSIQ